jgi:G3E family GTPase
MRLILTGGFLGSGKTTAIVAACRLLQLRSMKVAVITNDQGEDQVDSEYVKGLGIPHGEVVNGCFCCNYGKFDDRLTSLITDWFPDVVFAEAVGSCTDLIATVAKPLQRSRRDLDVVIPVFVDALLVSALMDGRASFLSDSVRYIFFKQIEEADMIILSKVDCMSRTLVNKISQLFNEQYPNKQLLIHNTFDPADIERWMDTCLNFNSNSRHSLEIDYDVYARGEAELSWGDKVLTIETENGEAMRLAEILIGDIFDHIQNQRLAIGHLKFYVEANESVQKISFTTMSTSAGVRLNQVRANSIKLLINARVESTPKILESIIQSAVDQISKRFPCKIHSHRESFFSPSFPTPTHRL